MAEHRPVAVALGALLYIDVLRLVLRLGLAGYPRPYTGLARVAFNADWFLLLGFPAISAILAARVFLASSAWERALGWLWIAEAAALTWLYPGVRGAALGEIYLVTHLLSAGLQVIFAIVYVAKKGWPDLPQIAVLILLMGDIAALAGPFAAGDLYRDWWVGRWQTALVYGALIAVQARSLWLSARAPTGLALWSRLPR